MKKITDFQKMKADMGALEYMLNKQLMTHQEYFIKLDLSNLITAPTHKKEKINDVYPLSLPEHLKAKENSNYRCEYDSSHESFIAPGGKMYVETHYLIPMYVQDLFENTLDFADNIITLCPECHMRLEKSLPEEREKMLKVLFEQKADCYEKYGIEIDFDTLLSFYE